VAVVQVGHRQGLRPRPLLCGDVRGGGNAPEPRSSPAMNRVPSWRRAAGDDLVRHAGTASKKAASVMPTAFPGKMVPRSKLPPPAPGCRFSLARKLRFVESQTRFRRAEHCSRGAYDTRRAAR
jgi:hypothetical protein